MKKSALLLTLAGLGLVAAPSHANIRVPITFAPNFTATLTNFTDGAFANITGTGPQGTFNFGQLVFDGTNNQLDIIDLTSVDPTPNDTTFVAPSAFPVLDEVDFANVTLTETLVGGSATTVPLGDLFGDPPTTVGYLDTGLIELLGPTVPAGATLQSATVTGQFTDGYSAPTAMQMTEVGAVPESSSFALLCLGLLPVGLVLGARARSGRRPL